MLLECLVSTVSGSERVGSRFRACAWVVRMVLNERYHGLVLTLYPGELVDAPSPFGTITTTHVVGLDRFG